MHFHGNLSSLGEQYRYALENSRHLIDIFMRFSIDNLLQVLLEALQKLGVISNY